MKKRFLLLLIALQCLPTSPVTAQANNKPATKLAADTGRTFALIIGVKNYKFIPPLNYADKDAKMFYDFLVTTQKDGRSAERIFLLLNEEVTQNAVASKLYRIREKVEPGDRVFIYFGGHGDMGAP
jgi:hypothetical protein